MSPSTASFGSQGGSGQFAVATGDVCTWSVQPDASWVIVTAGLSGTGNGNVSYSIGANTAPTGRTATLAINSKSFVVSQSGAAQTCSFAVAPASVSFPSDGGSGAESVSTGNGCAWSAGSDASWIQISSGATGNGSGSVQYGVSPNATTTAQTGTLTVAGQAVTVTEAPGSGPACNYSVAPLTTSFPATGGSSSVAVSTSSACNWTAASSVSWISVTAGATGNGSGTVQFAVAANAAGSRTGTLTVAGIAITISQAAGASCAFSINPTSASYAAAGGSGSVAVTTTPTCGWTASSPATWVQITSGASGTGSAAVQYSVDANSGGSRTVALTIAGNSFSVTEAAAGSCTYSVTPTSASYAVAGGTGSVAVSTTAGCTWTASSGATWVQITSGASGTGSGTVDYTVSVNSGVSSRSTTLTVAGIAVTISQSLLLPVAQDMNRIALLRSGNSPR